MRAPDFSLLDDQGQTIALSDVIKKGPVLLAFYPGDFTPVCTTQLCSYRDRFSEFNNLGIQIFGISTDPSDSHVKFKEKNKFPFPLLTDPKKKVAKDFGCASFFMLGAVSRAVFIVNKNQDIVYKYVEPIAITHRKPTELLDVVSDLKNKGLI